jgi:high affinity Mn2+ porin
MLLHRSRIVRTLPIEGFCSLVLLATLLAPTSFLLAQEAKPESPQKDPSKTPQSEKPPPPPAGSPFSILVDPDWSFHYQATAVEQARGSIHSPYASNLSLQKEAEHAFSYTTTLFLGRRLWDEAAIYFDPEIAGGNGLSNASGVAGFPNGEITRVNRPSPTPYVARLYFQQTISFGEKTEKVEPSPNQLSEVRSPTRLEFRFGKMALGDVFDDNAYAHDPRVQFMNWALFANGAWDYPADTRGYTIGPTVEFTWDAWALRYGIWLVPKEANGLSYDYSIAANHGQAVEGEYRWKIDEHPGVVRLLGYLNNARMGDFRETINNPALGMDLIPTRKNGRPKYGAGLSADQQLCPDLGAFLRAGFDDGKTETWAFTQIDRTLSAGLSLKGTSWGRPDDTVGLAYLMNGLSPDQRSFLSRGGQGFIIGDGQLHYKFEEIVEMYYACKILGLLTLTADYQYVRNPAYNGDRGPAQVFALRFHLDF